MVLPVLFLLAAVPVIVSGNLSGRGAYDQLLFHEPAIRRFSREWPVFDLRDYLSATTPGYHLLLAAYAKFIDPARAALQLAGSIFTVGLLATLAGACARRARLKDWARPDLGSLVCVLPAAASMYVLFPGIWLLPDNIGWWLVLAVLLIAVRPWTAWSPVVAGLALLALVFVRQSHLWAAGAVWAAAWVSVSPAPPAPAGALESFRGLFTKFAARAGALATAIAAAVPAVLIVLAFYKLWGGLVPPRFQSQYSGVSPAAPAFILSLLAIISTFYGGFLLPALADAAVRHRGVLGAAAVIGLIAALAPATTYDYDHGRSSGLWNIVRELPVIAGRTSPLIVLLAPAGAVAAAAWLLALPHRPRWVYLAALAGFTAAQAASPQLWQRYNEPFILVLVALWACDMPERAGPAAGPAGLAARLRLAGPVLLAILFGALTARTIATAEPVRPEASPQFTAPAAP